MKQTAIAWDFDPTLDRAQYVQRLLDTYRCTPTCAGRVRRDDRRLAHRLFDQRIPWHVVEAAFTLAAARRLYRSEQNEPLSPIRSLHYFLPLIDEIRQSAIDPAYIDYARRKVRNADRDLESIPKILEKSAALSR